MDPGLTARILRVANSSFYGLRAKVERISHAVSLLGTQHIHDFVLATSVVRAFRGIPRRVVDMNQFWRGSVTCGAVAKLLAERRGFLDCEHMFAVGLLTHVGRLALYMKLPDNMTEAHELAVQKHVPMADALRASMGFSDVEVAAELLGAWKLPDSFLQPIRFSASPSAQADENGFERACIVHVASRTADGETLYPQGESVIGIIDDAAWDALELTPSDFEVLLQGGRELSAEIADQFLPETA